MVGLQGPSLFSHGGRVHPPGKCGDWKVENVVLECLQSRNWHRNTRFLRVASGVERRTASSSQPWSSLQGVQPW